MFEWLYSQRTVTLGFPGQIEFALAAHQRITDGILARDPDRAERAMREHLEHGHMLYWNIMKQAEFAGSATSIREATDLAMAESLGRRSE